MKKVYILLAFVASTIGFAQTTEIFNNSGQSTGDFANWELINNVTTNAIQQSAGGGYLLLDAGNPGDIVITTNYNIFDYTNLQLKYSVATYGNGTNNSATVSISYDNGVTYSETFTSTTPTSSTYIDVPQVSLTPTSSTVKIKFTNTGTTGKGVRLKNIILSGDLNQSTSPILSTSLTVINNFEYLENQGPSTSQSFNISGSDLDGTDVVLTAPTNFEVSTNNTTFGSTATLTSFNGASTPIHVRLVSGLAINTYSGNISITGGGITTPVTIALSGEVTQAPVVLNPSITTSVTTLTALNYIEEQGPSTSQSFNINGTELNGTDVVLTAPSNFEVSSDNTTFSTTITLPTFNGTSTPIHVRLVSGLEIDAYSGNISITGGGITTPVVVALSGEVTEDPTASIVKNNIEDLKVYPNPATELVNITSNEIGTKNVTIFNMLGKKVLETSTEETVNVSTLTSGVYIMNITQDGKKASRKLVIK